jgi:hypothetical protein
MTETLPGVCLFTTKNKKVLQDNRLIPLYPFQFQDKCVFSRNVHLLCPQPILTSNAIRSLCWAVHLIPTIAEKTYFIDIIANIRCIGYNPILVLPIG